MNATLLNAILRKGSITMLRQSNVMIALKFLIVVISVIMRLSLVRDANLALL